MLNSTSIAPAVGASVRNVQFTSEATNLPRKFLVVGTYDSAKVGIAANETQLILSPEDAGNRYGFGSMLHRLALFAFAGTQGVPVYALPQAEAGGSVKAAGSLDFTASANVKAGTAYLYIAGQLVRVNLATGATAAQIATAAATAVNADKTLPVSALVDGVITGQVNLTAKSAGPWGNAITLAFNLGAGQVLPSGVAVTVTAMSAGAGVPGISAALDGLGVGDDANEMYFTDMVHGYGLDVSTLDAISAYVGEGNEATGLYAETVSRPFRALTGDTAAGSAGLNALVTISDNRKLDRANGVVSVPGSYSHPSEIAALAMGQAARINQKRAAQSYLGIALSGVNPGDRSDRWTSDYDTRDLAMRSGVSPTRVQAGTVYLQALVTFYRPDDAPVNSNGYRSMRNIAIIQNLLYNIRMNFEQEKWQGISIVADTAAVTDSTDREKARDIDSVKDDGVALAYAFERKAWIHNAAFTINKLKEAGAVTVRPDGLGFNCNLSVIFSGEGGIIDTEVAFDTSLAVLLN
jgi:phage tail sheath gpL-like